MNDERRRSSWIGQALILLADAVLLVLGGIRAWGRRRPQEEEHPSEVIDAPRRQTERERQARRLNAPLWGYMIIGFIGLLLVAWLVYSVPEVGPAQPIPFSHRVHVDTKNLNCFFCHTSATFSANAGMPSVEKCLLCHNVIATRFQPIAQVVEHYERGKPIEWVRVNKTPEHIKFSHQIHLTQGFDCSRCHGNVRAMDRIQKVHEFNMNFCVTCHWDNNASSSCYVCHY